MPRYINVTNELLSAYLDDAVTASERSLVEAAVADDPEIAKWRLATLQHTVNLLGRLPEVALPRSFTLTEALVADSTVGNALPAPVTHTRPVSEPEKVGFWQAWQSFWQGGNLLMRNAAVGSFAAFLVLLAVTPMFSPQQSASSNQAADSVAEVRLDEGLSSAESSNLDRSTARTAAPQTALTTADVKSAPAEPIPLPAVAAEEAEAVAMNDSTALSSEASPEIASAPVRTDANSELIATATFSTDADESAVMAARAVDDVTDESTIETALVTSAAVSMAAAPLADTDGVILSEEDVSDEDVSEEDVSEEDVSEESVNEEGVAEVSAAAMVSSADNDVEPDNISNAPSDSTTDGQDEATVALAATSDESDEPVLAEVAAAEPPPVSAAAASEPAIKAAPVEPVAIVEAPSLDTSQGSTVTSAQATSTITGPVTNLMATEPILFVQIIALTLTLLFIALWLLSRRPKSTPQ